MRALEMLNYLGALDDDGNLTDYGVLMSDFPVDPQFAKALMCSPSYNCAEEMLIIISMLNVPVPFLRPNNDRKKADEAKSQFEHEDGDHLTLLNAYYAYKENGESQKWCYENYLNIRNLRQADNVRSQLERYLMRCGDLGGSTSLEDPKYWVSIRKALCNGLFMQIAHLEKNGKYMTVKDNQPVLLHPSSCLSTKPEWVMYQEFVLTSRNYIRTCTTVKGDWLMELAPEYYDLRNFPEGDTKRALERILKKIAKKKSKQ
ncbi:Pre-mRNA-splicing factor ATP-dependent RNA helicase dhx15 [Terramyces sp. JEL0728]|nr:Pre-mRNA-splicing factor ATP-dependent RNA helicase dhx15 [Terramyces sp. JEL0728]